MRKRRQYRRLQEYENMVYGVYDMEEEDNDLWFKQQWHFRYAYRLKALIDKSK